MNNEIMVFSTDHIQDRELVADFHEFFYMNNLIQLFTNEHFTGQINVSYLDARSVVYKDTYRRDFDNLSYLLENAQDNKMYEEAVFKIIHHANGFQKMMQNIRKLNAYFSGEIKEEHKFNLWNIVYYNDEFF